MAASHFGGSYPWKIDSETESIIHVRNTTDEKASFLLQIDYDSGSYTLPAQALGPGQQRAVDLRQLRDGQVKDSIGRVIPLEVERGQATWIENGRQALTGRIEIFSVSAAVASSLSCQIPANNTCCPPETFEVFLAPNVLTTSVGSTSFLQFLERRRRECDGAMFGPFDVTAQAVWSSSNTAVATVGAVTADGCPVSSIAPGHANVHADYNGASYTPDSTEPNCVLVPVPFPADCPIDVLPHIDSISPARGVQGIALRVTITGTGFTTPASVTVAGTGITVSEIQVGNATEILATFTLAADAAGGDHAVTITANGQTSDNSVNFFVQVPTSLSALSVATLPTGTSGDFGCAAGADFGIKVSVKLQVNDQSGNPILSNRMEPQEKVTNVTFNGAPIGDFVPNWSDIGPSRISGTSQFTDSVGTFLDAPYGACNDRSFTHTFTQTISILLGNNRYTVRTNGVTVSSSSAGQGSITNASDIQKSRP